MSCRKNGGREVVISDQGSVIRTRHAFFGKKVPEGRMMVGLVVGALARWAFASISTLTAIGNRSFDFAQDDGWRE